MTKNQLIKKLNKIKGNPIIVTSSDAEGNSFSTLYEISGDLLYDSENREILDEEEIKEIEEYDLSRENLQKCIVLWPG